MATMTTTMTTRRRGRVDIGGGLTIPAEITATAEDISGYAVQITAGYDADSGRYVTRRLMVQANDGEVTSEGIRAIPVASVLRLTVTGVVGPMLFREVGQPAPVGKAGPTEETLRAVARIYRLAVLLGGPATQQVAISLGVPRSTAGRWVTRARDRGYLTVTDRRTARGQA